MSCYYLFNNKNLASRCARREKQLLAFFMILFAQGAHILCTADTSGTEEQRA